MKQTCFSLSLLPFKVPVDCKFWSGLATNSFFLFDFCNTVEPCILEQIDYLWGLAMAKAMI